MCAVVGDDHDADLFGHDRRELRGRLRSRSVKVLLIAPTCDGLDVGEAWVAYQWVRRIAARHDATLLTYYKRGRVPAAEQLEGVRVVEWQEPPLVGRAERLNSMLKPGYVPFYVHARRWIKAALPRGRALRSRAPGRAASRCGIPPLPPVSAFPLVIGPVGGSLETPPNFDTDGDTSPWYVGLRALRSRAHALGSTAAPHVRRGSVRHRHRSVRIGDPGSPTGIRRFEVMSETGIEALPPPTQRVAHSRTRSPALRRADRAYQGPPRRDPRSSGESRATLPVVLDVVGDGFDRAACRGARGIARPQCTGSIPRLSSPRANRRLLPTGRHLRVPELPRARRQCRLRGDGFRSAADRERSRRPRQCRRRHVRDPRPPDGPRAVRDRTRECHLNARRRLRT